MFRNQGLLTRFGLALGLLFLLGASVGSRAAYADCADPANCIGLGAQTNGPEFQFVGTGGSVIDIVLLDNLGAYYDMASGSGYGAGTLFAANGNYEIDSTIQTPFTLMCTGTAGEFSATEITPVTFSFTASTGTLTGTINFTDATDTGNGTLAGILTVTGGTFASEFPSGFGDVELTLANGFPLQTLCNATGSVNSEIDAGTITPTPVSTGACPLTQGYWKNHPTAWPVPSLTIGGVTISEAVLITILKTPPKKGNATLILLHQLIATLLNQANGSVVDSVVQATIDDAQSLLTGKVTALGKVTYVAASSTLGSEMVSDAATLDLFNNGAFSVGCTND